MKLSLKEKLRTLCDPIDGSPPGSPVPGILQARTLEWVAISFSNAWKWKVKVKLLSRVRPLATPWTEAYQAPPSMGFSRQEYWSGCHLVAWLDSVLLCKYRRSSCALLLHIKGCTHNVRSPSISYATKIKRFLAYFSFCHLWGWYCGSISNILLTGFRVHSWLLSESITTLGFSIPSFLLHSLPGIIFFYKGFLPFSLCSLQLLSLSLSLSPLWIHGSRLEFVDITTFVSECFLAFWPPKVS